MLLDFSPDIIIEIMQYLSCDDLAACQLAHSSFHSLIASSPQIQYNIAMHLAGVEENVNQGISIRERLVHLNTQERMWHTMNSDFRHTVKMDDWAPLQFTTGTLWTFKGTLVRSCDLSSKESVPPEWSTLDIGDPIIGLVLAVHEHNLVAPIVRWVLTLAEVALVN